MCKHCEILVNYQKSSESIRTHLNICSLFRKAMNGVKGAERPDWYRKNTNSGRKVRRPAALSTTSIRKTLIKLFGISSVTKHWKTFFQQKMAMHYYATGPPFQHIEGGYLKTAIKFLGSETNLLPTRMQLASKMLDT